MLKGIAQDTRLQGGRTLGAALEQSNGIGPGFNTLRLAFCIAVLMTHAFDLSRSGVASEPVRIFSGDQVSFGGLALYMLFFISGLLVTASFLRAKSISDFALRRTMRLMPALVVVIAITALVLGPAVTTLPLSDYFNDPQFSTFLWNMGLIGNYTLPGVFETNPNPHGVNGSLSTLRYEVLCYILLAIFGAAGAFRRRWFIVAAAILIIPLGWLAKGHSWYFFAPLGMHLSGVVRVCAYFIAGMLVYAYRDAIILDRRIAIAAAILCVVSARFGGFHVVFPLAGGYLVTYLGMQAALGVRFLETNDYSYGTYAYAFPLQQLIIFWAPALAVWWINILLALPLTLMCAALSWHFVEKPALSLVKSWKRRSIPASSAFDLHPSLEVPR